SMLELRSSKWAPPPLNNRFRQDGIFADHKRCSTMSGARKGQEKGNVPQRLSRRERKSAKYLRKVARPAGLKPATSRYVARRNKATPCSATPLPPRFCRQC